MIFVNSMSDLFHEDIPASYIEQVLLYRSGRELVASSSMSWMRRMVLWAELGGWALDHRYATRQLNHAYTVVLAAQFQGFCRDLHSESADMVAGAIGSLNPVGSIVGVRTAGGEVIPARVIEDRGNLGVNGRRIVRLEVDVTYSDPVRFERPVEWLLPAPA